MIPPKPPARRGRPRKNNNVTAATVGVGTSGSTLNQNEVPARAATRGARMEVPLSNPTRAGTSSVGIKRSLFQTGSSAGILVKRSRKVNGASMGVTTRKTCASTSGTVGHSIRKVCGQKYQLGRGKLKLLLTPLKIANNMLHKHCR